jgi:hypothetical protein
MDTPERGTPKAATRAGPRGCSKKPDAGEKKAAAASRLWKEAERERERSRVLAASSATWNRA